MKPNACPICLSSLFDVLVDFGEVPRSGTFLSEPEQPYWSIQLSYEFCLRCAYIRSKISEEGLHDYIHDERSTGHWIPIYAVEIAESLKRKGIGPDALIIEIGANDGSFLDVLRRTGFTNCLGVEPSVACTEIGRSKQHQIENVHLDQAQAMRIRERYGVADAVFCRHTLEHVPDAFGLLVAMRSLLRDNGILFIEVPDSRGIICDLHLHELWDEHLHGFTPENLSLLVRRAGLRVDTTLLKPHRGLTNILLWCIPGLADDPPSASFPVFTRDVEHCRSLAASWALLCRGLLGDLTRWPRPISCLGASHPQSNFLLFSRLGRHVSFLVDDDPIKIGRYVPIPEPVPVISTERFLTDGLPGTVMRTAFGYEDWMDRILARFASNGVRIVSPYDSKFIS